MPCRKPGAGEIRRDGRYCAERCQQPCKSDLRAGENLADGKDAAAGTNWKIDNKIVRVPYVGVDKDNLSQFTGK